MSETESPESEVGGSVGDGAKTVLNCVDGLVNEDLTKLELFSLFLSAIIFFTIHLAAGVITNTIIFIIAYTCR